MRFELAQNCDVSLHCGGRTVRERIPYEAGKHETILDFLPDCTQDKGRGHLAIAMLIWEEEMQGDAAADDGGERKALQEIEVRAVLVEEPPNILVQFPPDGYTFQDPDNVNVAALVSYFAFHRYPSILDGLSLVPLSLSLSRARSLALVCLSVCATSIARDSECRNLSGASKEAGTKPRNPTACSPAQTTLGP